METHRDQEHNEREQPRIESSQNEPLQNDRASEPFVGQWNRLVSSTNWEKGRIIHEWRESLVAAGSPSAEYSDEAWSNLVGGVTSQHVGRLRRVHARFGDTRGNFDGLFWSHFQASLDWDDAEMWLEGAVQSGWSVARMRGQRSETLGAPDGLKPGDEDVLATVVDEDFVDPDASRPEPDLTGTTAEMTEPSGPLPEGPDFGDESGAAHDPRAPESDVRTTDDDTAEPVRPFAELAELPADVGEAFEAFKLAILRHKADKWRELSCDDVLGTLDALKELALAPPVDESAPF